jgi:hypothetical protein
VFQHSGLCLAQADTTVNGGEIVQTSCSVGARSQWTYNGTTIVNRATGACLDVDGANTANGTRLISWTCHGNANQRWTAIS